MSETQIRALNRRIATAYDLLPFDQASHIALEPSSIFGAASVYGCHSERRDVLDLGCGTGRLLAAAAGVMSGRVVGVDLASSACEEARRQCATYGDRTQIIEADFLDLTPADLGQFDLIYLLGTIYVVPEPVRDHLLDLVSSALKPGGVAVVGYYSGLMHAAKAHIYRIIRRLVALDASPLDATSQARVLLAEMESNASETVIAAIQNTRALTDVELYHEAFSPAFAPALTLELESRLSRSGIRFLNLLGANNCGRLPTLQLRAAEVERQDLAGGSYRRALFGRCGDREECSLFSSQSAWHCDLMRVSAAGAYQAPGTYRHPASGLEVVIHDSVAQALIDEMIAEPRPLPNLAGSARQRLESHGFSGLTPDPALMESTLGEMWDYRLINPLA